MKTDLISVIIPVYNSGKYLRRCLDSVISQKHRSVEIICINDCSNDNSLSIIEEYYEKDPRIRLISNSRNMGVSYTRNKGINAANGEWISFVDSDDWIEPDMYEKMLCSAHKYGSQIVMSDLVVDENNSVKDYSIKNLNKDVFYQDEIDKELLPRFSWSGSENLGLYSFTTKLFSSRLIKENSILFETQTSYEEDKLFVINALAHCDCISYIRKNFYKYEVHPSGLYSSFNIAAWKWYVFNYKEKQRLINKYNISNINQQLLKEEFIYNISWFLKRCSRLKDKSISKSIQLYVLKNPEVKEICRDCLPMLTSIERKIALGIINNRPYMALLLIRLNHSPYKLQIFSILKKFRK